MVSQSAGYREIEHTADWELEAWAPNMASLLEQAARGMYSLSRTRLQPGPRQERLLEIQATDREQMLVSFLSELLYLDEMEGLGFDQYKITIDDDRLRAEISGAPVASTGKEIKAVTYHRLAVKDTEQGLRVNVVLDV